MLRSMFYYSTGLRPDTTWSCWWFVFHTRVSEMWPAIKTMHREHGSSNPSCHALIPLTILRHGDYVLSTIYVRNLEKAEHPVVVCICGAWQLPTIDKS